MSEISETLINIGWKLTYYVTVPILVAVAVYEAVTWWRGGAE